MQFNLKQLEAFVWVADLQSFRGAAERLNTTQPNISARIAKLESAVGTSLMSRDSGVVRLTAKGQELLRHARRVLDATDGFLTAADRKALTTGTLRLGVTEMIVHTWLRRYLRALNHRFPRLTVEVTVDFSVHLEKLLAERALDLALQNEPFARAFGGVVEVGAYPLVWLAAPGLTRDRTLSDALLTAQPILTHARDTRLYDEIAAHLATRREIAPRLVPSTNLALCRTMALDGLGLTVLPEAMVAEDLAEGRLVRLAYPWVPEPLHFFARYDADRAPRAVAEAAGLAAEIARS
ncbi:LysR family transcriptional regulator [Yoonia sp.]|uniref:LysR family transcriptional regulator n=1 Tax=Yoonia sp. TaxID=2212373 RepID=UPI002FDAAE15